MATGPCALYGTHRMRAPKNVGVVDSSGNQINSEFRTNVSLYTCGCGDRFMCSGTPHTGDYIRYYCTEGAILGYKPTPVGGGVYTVNKNLVYLLNSSYLAGYNFSL